MNGQSFHFDGVYYKRDDFFFFLIDCNVHRNKTKYN